MSIAAGLLPIPRDQVSKVTGHGELMIQMVNLFTLTIVSPSVRVDCRLLRMLSCPVLSVICQKVLQMCSYQRLVNTLLIIWRQHNATTTKMNFLEIEGDTY